MSFEYFIAKRISYQSNRSFSRVIIKLALVAVALSISIMLVSDAIVIGFKSEIKNKITGFAGHIQVSKVGARFSYENEPITYDTSFVNEASALKGVTHIQTYANKPGIMKTESETEGIVLKGVGPDFDWSYIDKNMERGLPLSLQEPVEADEIIVSRTLANRLLLDTGSIVDVYFVQEPVRVRRLVVKGIYQTNIEELDKIYCLVDLRHIQKLNNWNNKQIGGYEVFIKDVERMDELNEDIRYMNDLNIDASTIQDRYPQIFDWLGLLNVNVVIILALMAVVAGINMITALIIMILERTQMIGVLKAMGTTNTMLGKVFLYNSMTLIGLGLLVGNVASFALIFLQNKFHLFTLAQESYYVSEVPVLFSLSHFVVINTGAFICCIIFLLLPSLLVMRVRPVKAIRFE